MKITKEKIIRELKKEYGRVGFESEESLEKELIKDTINVIDSILRKQKGISINGKK